MISASNFGVSCLNQAFGQTTRRETGRYLSLLLIVIEISDGNMELRNGRVGGQGGVEMEMEPLFRVCRDPRGSPQGFTRLIIETLKVGERETM
jgi:hypothetical protein